MKEKGIRLFYVLCFFSLNVIDLLRHTQNGHIGSLAANLTGVIIFLLAMSGLRISRNYIYFYGLWTIFSMGIGSIGVKEYLANPGSLWIYTTLAEYFNWYLIGILFITVIGNYKNEWRDKRKITISGALWLIFLILVMVSKNEERELFWISFLCVGFFCVRYGEDRKKVLFEGMVNGTILAFFVLQIYAYGFRPWDEVRYKGAYANCNMAALHYLVVFCMLLIRLYLLEKKNATKWEKGVTVFLAGGLFSFQLFTLCRTALGVSVILTIMYGILVVGFLWKKKIKEVLIREIFLIACILITIPCVFLTIRYLPAILHHPVWYAGEYSEEKIHSFDPVDSPKYITAEEFLRAAFGRLSENDEFVKNVDPEASGSLDFMERVFGRRGQIYKAYLPELNMTGHERGSVPRQSIPDYTIYDAHNLLLQIMYNYGVPSGIVLLAVLLLLLIRTGKSLIKKKQGDAVLSFFVTVTFLLFSVTGLVWCPGQYILTVMFLVQHPQLNQECEIKEISQ